MERRGNDVSVPRKSRERGASPFPIHFKPPGGGGLRRRHPYRRGGVARRWRGCRARRWERRMVGSRRSRALPCSGDTMGAVAAAATTAREGFDKVYGQRGGGGEGRPPPLHRAAAPCYSLPDKPPPLLRQGPVVPTPGERSSHTRPVTYT